MKNIILFEGIASSGKTTLEKLLVEQLHNAVVISEEDTLMPIINNKDSGISLAYLQKQLKHIIDSLAKNIIVDRFHFTHAFRTQSDLGAFADIETELQKAGNVLVVLLTVDSDRIKERIEDTILRRGDNWKQGAQGNIDEKVVYYTKQQEALSSLLSASHLPSITINTTGKAWSEYVDEITNHLKQES